VTVASGGGAKAEASRAGGVARARVTRRAACSRCERCGAVERAERCRVWCASERRATPRRETANRVVGEIQGPARNVFSDANALEPRRLEPALARTDTHAGGRQTCHTGVQRVRPYCARSQTARWRRTTAPPAAARCSAAARPPVRDRPPRLCRPQLPPTSCRRARKRWRLREGRERRRRRRRKRSALAWRERS